MRRIKITLALVLIMAVSGVVQASYPDYEGYVNDFAGVMSNRNKAEVQLIAEKLDEEQGIQLAVVTIDTTAPEAPVDYRVKLFEAWGIGGPEDSGLLILLALEEREIWVEVGYGLEPILTDGKVGAIIDEHMLAHFQQGQWGDGLSAGARAFQAALSGEEFAKAPSKKESDWLLSLIIFLIIAVFVSIQAKRNPPGGSGRRYRSYPRSTFGGPRFPGGGGGSKGGFGGFGGGRSGGGGAGRKF